MQNITPPKFNRAAQLGIYKKLTAGAYIPAKSLKELKQYSHAVASGKIKPREEELRLFAKSFTSNHAIQSKSQREKVIEGFLEHEHEAGQKLKGLYNQAGHEGEQARRILKEYDAKIEASQPKGPAGPSASERLEAMRNRLGIQHGIMPAKPAPAISQAHTPPMEVPHRLTSISRAPSWTPAAHPPDAANAPAVPASSPAFSPFAAGLTGGESSGSHRDDLAEPSSGIPIARSAAVSHAAEGRSDIPVDEPADPVSAPEPSVPATVDPFGNEE